MASEEKIQQLVESAVNRALAQKDEEIAELKRRITELEATVGAKPAAGAKKTTGNSAVRPTRPAGAAAANAAATSAPNGAASGRGKRTTTAGKTKREPAAGTSSDPLAGVRKREEERAKAREGKEEIEGIRYHPLVGAVYPPADHTQSPEEGKAPDVTVELEVVHGYRGHDRRSNVHVVASGEVAYFMAATAILYNVATNTQRYYRGHTDDISSMAVHPNGRLIATGQVGKEPAIHVWEVDTLRTVATIKGFHERSVVALGFSADGHQLVSIGADNFNSIAVYEWEHGHKVVSTKGGSSTVLVSEYFPGRSGHIVTGGAKHIKFWTLTSSGVEEKQGAFGTPEAQTVVSIAFAKSYALTGTFDGRLMVWSEEGKVVADVATAHNGAVNAVLVLRNGQVVSGGKDGKIKYWDVSAEGAVTEVKAVDTQLPIRAMAELPSGELVVGTTTNTLVLAVGANGTPTNRVITKGHTSGEVWALALHPTNQDLAISGGEDGTIHWWSISQKANVNSYSVKNAQIHSLAFSHSGNWIAVGTSKGKVVILGSEGGAQWSQVGEWKERKESISALAFAPGDKLLAVGSHDNFIDIYDTATWRKKLTLKGHSSYITHLDWSADAKYLQSTSGAYEYLYWNATNGQQVTVPSKLRNTEFETWTCTLGWPVMGIWPEGSDGTDVNAVARSHNKHLLAAATDFGTLLVFRYPSCVPHAKNVQARGHSSHVTNVVFSHDDHRLITTGGADLAVMQWRIVPARS